MSQVSIVMSVFNQEKYLPSAIESILNQSYQDFEFIIVNDGSNDSCNDIILSYKDKRIILIEQEIKIQNFISNLRVMLISPNLNQFFQLHNFVTDFTFRTMMERQFSLLVLMKLSIQKIFQKRHISLLNLK